MAVTGLDIRCWFNRQRTNVMEAVMRRTVDWVRTGAARLNVAWMNHRVRDDEEGQGMVEYALILVLIAVVVIVILTVVGKQVNNVFSNVSNGLDG